MTNISANFDEFLNLRKVHKL